MDGEEALICSLALCRIVKPTHEFAAFELVPYEQRAVFDYNQIFVPDSQYPEDEGCRCGCEDMAEEDDV